MSSKRYRKIRGVYAKSVAEETIILDINAEEYYGLNDVGSAIWQQLENEAGATFEEMHSRLISHYDQSAEIIRQDLEELLETLTSSGLIEEIPEP